MADCSRPRTHSFEKDTVRRSTVPITTVFTMTYRNRRDPDPGTRLALRSVEARRFSMFSNRLAFAALGAACIVAAAAGGYLASRQNVTPTASLAASTPPSRELAPTTIPDRPVQETEAV